MIKHAEIEVSLVGGDGNAFAVLGKVKRALAVGGVSSEEVAEFMTDATSGDYDNLLSVCARWVTIV